MASKILTQFKQSVHGLELEPSGGGCFELTVDGQLLYSKLHSGEFPNDRNILSLIEERIPRG